MSETTSAPLSKNELLKQRIPTLAGNIAATLADPALEKFSEDDEQFIKFHGIYQQDDRDLRKTGKKWLVMIRGRIPGGVVKKGIGPLIKRINESMLSPLAACGDVNRNITVSPTPATTKARADVFADSLLVMDALAPQTKAYHSIWVDNVQLNLDAAENTGFVDPLYGATYLPRKFKTCFVIPPSNDMDLYTNDLGFIAIIENDQLVGYNVAVGGGLGRSHGNDATYTRLADVIGFITPDRVVEVAKAVLTIHRDFGDRTNRKHARLKYVLEERGVDWFRIEVEQRAGIKLAPARPFEFTKQGDLLGWHQQTNGNYFLGLFVENGRIRDEQGYELKTGLCRVIEQFG